MTEPMRVLITGSRDFDERPIIAAALSQVARENPGRLIIVVEGAAKGADSLAGAVARAYPGRLLDEPHPAQWRRPDGSTNRGAGHARNNLMIGLGADVCLAFLKLGAGNVGTRACMAGAAAAGIPVREHWSTS